MRRQGLPSPSPARPDAGPAHAPASGGAAFYEAAYSPPSPEAGILHGRWRALGADSKAAHAEVLCRRAGLVPHGVVEIGCGDGALLCALAARGLGRAFDGFDVSRTAIAAARARGVPGAGRIEAYDGSRLPASGDAYDLAVLSHVLEHVVEPAALLAEAARVAPWVLLEVPLEDNRSARRPRVRARSARIGHVQAFDRAAVGALCAHAGLRPVAEAADPLPYAHHAFFAASRAGRIRAAAKWAVRTAAWRAAPRRAERWFTVHYAVLATRA